MRKTLATLLLSIGACSSVTMQEPEEPFPLPDCTTTFHTVGEYHSLSSSDEDSDLGLGEYRLGLAENSLWSTEGADYFSRKLPQGLTFYLDRKGGTGNTLEVIGCHGTLFMQWAFGGLNQVAITGHWDVETDKGLRLGDSLERFLDLYPSAKENDMLPLTINGQEDIYGSGHFSVVIRNGVVRAMEVGPVNYDSLTADESFYLSGPVGPDNGPGVWK